MRVAICEDQAREREKLTDFLNRFEKENGVGISVTGYESAEELLWAFEAGQSADILFLDIYMKGMNGMDAAKRLYARGFEGSFVFCTTSREHGVESYAVNADGYLLKPYDWGDFCHAMEKCRPRWQKNLKTLSFLCDRLEMRVYLKDVLYVETRRHGCVVHAREQRLETRKPMKAFVQELKREAAFLPVGQAYLVNLSHMRDWDDEAVLLENGARVPLPVRERAELKRRLTEYQWLLMEADR